MKGKEVVGNVLMDITEEGESLSLTILLVLRTSSPAFKVFDLRKLGFLDPIDLSWLIKNHCFMFSGSKLLEFSGGSHVFPTTSVVNPSWGNSLVSVAVANGSSYGQNQSYVGSSPAKTGIMFPISSSPNSNRSTGKQFPFLQEEQSSRTASLCERMTSCIHDSDCALSLLSSSSSSVPPLLQPPLSLSQEAVETVLYGSGLFENVSAVSDGSVISGNEAVALPQTFPFHWE